MTSFEMPDIHIPPEWEQIEFDGISGVHMIIGSPDVGKSTLARYLYQKICLNGQTIAFLDGDPGQSALGPPGTETIAMGNPSDPVFPPRGAVWRKFIGSTTPSGHLLPTVVGAKRLVDQAWKAQAGAVIYDTSGLVDPRLGGLALKLAKIDLLQPTRVYAIQREKELEPLLNILRRAQCCELIQLRPVGAVKPRNPERRQAYRARQFAEYFQGAMPQRIKWIKFGIYPAPHFALDRLVALVDQQGFTQTLGIVLDEDRDGREVTLLAPPIDLSRIKTMYLGDILVDAHSFQDRRID